MPLITPAGYYTGHVRAANKDFLIALSARRHRRMLAGFLAVPPPSSWDSRALGWVGAIKNQSQCGSCYIFSGTFVLECAYNKAGVGGGPDKMVLSEEYSLDCLNVGGCGGGDNTSILEAAKNKGIPLTADYGPYQGHESRCKFSQTMKLFMVNDWGFAGSSQNYNSVTDTADIKAAIMNYGCVGCAVDAGFNDPGTGVISGRGNNIDHDVALVGWDDSKGNGGAWIMRNSWGTGWGDGGYAWIEYGAYSIGTESVWAVVNAVTPPIDWVP